MKDFSHNYEHYASKPLRVISSRVRRTYQGGKNIDIWNGNQNQGSINRPEEWVASVTGAINSGFENEPLEGLSLIHLDSGEMITLQDLINSDPSAFLGEEHVSAFGNQTAILVKLIDSAQRLSIQVHPDKDFAREVFHSAFGKTEAWYIINTFEIDGVSPYILMGFKPHVTRELWEEAFRKQDIPAMISYMHQVKPESGDTYYIEGGLPHAIGPGCFLIEVQEPTDYTLRTERSTTDGRTIPDALVHQGIGFDRMLDCFHYEGLREEGMLTKCKIKPDRYLYEYGTVCTTLIGKETTTCFTMKKLDVKNKYSISRSESTYFSILIVLSGEGILEWAGGSESIKQADQFFVPSGVDSITLHNCNESPLCIIQCEPPGII
jgi:mannose-6-phosphate isomerase